MREGQYSLATIGLLNLVRVPWTIKFLWSPFVDRHCVTVRDYKRTIIATELIYAVALLATGLINVRSEIMLVVILAFISMLASATQDIATDALAILSFKKHDHSMLNSMQSMGAFRRCCYWWRSLAYLTEKLWLECCSTLLSLVCLYDDYSFNV